MAHKMLVLIPVFPDCIKCYAKYKKSSVLDKWTRLLGGGDIPVPLDEKIIQLKYNCIEI